jgi:predicted anti-sigma-YlaC factor YlaD
MKCDTAREALSARIDGEQEPAPAAAVDHHQMNCASCQNWYMAARGLHRSMVVAPAPAIPDLTEAILAQVQPPRTLASMARIALGVVAVVQTALALSQLFGADTGMSGEQMVFMMGHMNHESASWNLAVGIGLSWAAMRTRTAAAQLPMLTVFVATLAGMSVLDVLRGDVSAARLLSHLPLVVGVALLYLVRRTRRDGDEPGRRRVDTAGTPGAPAAHTTRIPRPRFGRQRPTGHHHAA